jgi:uroporphyrinogen decarboxylase
MSTSAPLTSRQRVHLAFARQQPDRVPIQYLDNPGLRQRLKTHFGLTATDDEGLLLRLGTDFRGIWPAYRGPRLHPEIPDRHVDPVWGTRTRWIAHQSGGYWDYCDYPLMDAPPDTYDRWPMPSPDHFDYACVPAICQQHPDRAIHLGDPGIGDIMNSAGMLMGVQQAMIEIIDPDSPLQRLTDRRIAAQLGMLERALCAAKGRIDFLWIGEDLGTQRGPLISMDTYRRFIKPRHKKFVDLAKSWNIPVMIHSCGSSSWAFDEFIDLGISAVDTLQPEAANMAPAYLKSRWGNQLTFHGCISTAGPVAYGTVEQVRANMRETLEIMMPGGGYCMAPTHCLQDNSPTENVVAMYQAAREFGRYT